MSSHSHNTVQSANAAAKRAADNAGLFSKIFTDFASYVARASSHPATLVLRNARPDHSAAIGIEEI